MKTHSEHIHNRTLLSSRHQSRHLYSHYSNINDLLKSWKLRCSTFKNAPESSASVGIRTSYSSKITAGFLHASRIMPGYLHGNTGDYGDKDFVLHLIYLVTRFTRKHISVLHRHNAKTTGVFLRHTSAGCIGLLRHWLDEEMLTPPDKVAAMAEQFMMHGAAFSQPQKMTQSVRHFSLFISNRSKRAQLRCPECRKRGNNPTHMAKINASPASQTGI